MTHLSQIKLAAFRDELEKLAQAVTDPSHPDYESMSGPKWKQTARDVAAAVVGTGLGYGIGKTLSEEMGRHALEETMRHGTPPSWVKGLPVGLGIMTSLGSIAMMRNMAAMKARRQKAEATGKVVP